MPLEGYADPVTNDGPRFHSNMPISELTERVARAIKASNISSAPPIVETTDGVMHGTRPTPTKAQRGLGAQVARHRLGKSIDHAGRRRDTHGQKP